MASKTVIRPINILTVSKTFTFIKIVFRKIWNLIQESCIARSTRILTGAGGGGGGELNFFFLTLRTLFLARLGGGVGEGRGGPLFYICHCGHIFFTLLCGRREADPDSNPQALFKEIRYLILIHKNSH